MVYCGDRDDAAPARTDRPMTDRPMTPPPPRPTCPKTPSEIGARIGEAIARDTIADDYPREWTGIEAQDGDQITAAGIDPDSPEWDAAVAAAHRAYAGALVRAPTRWEASGPVRGPCGHRHRTRGAATECLARDRRACDALSGGCYSDRRVIRIG